MGTARLKCVCNHLDRFIWVCRVMVNCVQVYNIFISPQHGRGKCQGPVVQSIVSLTVLFKGQLVFSIFRLQYYHFIIIIIIRLFVAVVTIRFPWGCFISAQHFSKPVKTKILYPVLPTLNDGSGAHSPVWKSTNSHRFCLVQASVHN